MLALLDGDILCYRCGWACEHAAEGVAKWQIDQTITRIIEETNASDWKIYLSGDNNFRYFVFPDYKANRRDMRRPRWLEPLREHLVSEWSASIADGYEADDAIGIESSLSPDDSVVCSIDKDLRQLPTNHYHFVNRTWLHISPLEGWRNFFLQLLTGDATDNIKGCPGIGNVKAERALRDLTSASGFYEAVVEHYYAVYKESWSEELELNATLLYILRKENDSWNPPTAYKPLKQEQGATHLSTIEIATTCTEAIVLTSEPSPSDGTKTESSTVTSEKLR